MPLKLEKGGAFGFCLLATPDFQISEKPTRKSDETLKQTWPKKKQQGRVSTSHLSLKEWPLVD
jgi:hypothetical protein